MFCFLILVAVISMARSLVYYILTPVVCITDLTDYTDVTDGGETCARRVLRLRAIRSSVAIRESPRYDLNHTPHAHLAIQ